MDDVVHMEKMALNAMEKFEIKKKRLDGKGRRSNLLTGLKLSVAPLPRLREPISYGTSSNDFF